MTAKLQPLFHRSRISMGGLPMPRPSFPSVEAVMLSRGSDEQLTTITEIDRLEAEVPRKTLTIWADRNTRYMSEVPPERQALWSRARREISDRFFERLARGEIGWCGVTLPTQGFAQDAGMSRTSSSEPATSRMPIRWPTGGASRSDRRR